MRFLLDTMVVSEAAKPLPNAGVIAWLESEPHVDMAISVMTIGEAARGIERMAEGRRKRSLESWLIADLAAQFEGRVLPIDLEIARAWGELTAAGDRGGRPLPTIDGLLLATARVHSLTVVTRNVADFQDRGVSVLNPYS
ncbi:MAG: type II toxin-antitoxin system VapC family toxin [Gemmatimonadota bacterium]